MPDQIITNTHLPLTCSYVSVSFVCSEDDHIHNERFTNLEFTDADVHMAGLMSYDDIEDRSHHLRFGSQRMFSFSAHSFSSPSGRRSSRLSKSNSSKSNSSKKLGNSSLRSVTNSNKSQSNISKTDSNDSNISKTDSTES